MGAALTAQPRLDLALALGSALQLVSPWHLQIMMNAHVTTRTLRAATASNHTHLQSRQNATSNVVLL